MYLRAIKVRNIKCFDEITIDFASPPDSTGGLPVRRWTVILGENGLGKSSLLQSMAIVLAGPSAMRELVPAADGWVRAGATHGEVYAMLESSEGDAPHSEPRKKEPYRASFAVTGPDTTRLPPELQEASSYPVITEWTGKGTKSTKWDVQRDMSLLKKTAYAEGKTGWFACGYGAFRRLSGNSQDADKLFLAGRRSARFVTLFREDSGLAGATIWLVRLYNTARDGDEKSARSLDLARHVLERDFLAEEARLVVDAVEARLKIGDREPIGFYDLSAGYRSMLALGVDLLRWLVDAFPESANPLEERGVVLIDELDAHLHPQWQRQIGEWLLAKFPRLQFIVVTHSPFLARVQPEGNILLHRREGRVVAETGPARVADWRIEQVLTDLFDLPTVRSVQFENHLQELLRLRAQKAKGLTAEAQARLDELEGWALSLPLPIEDPSDRARAERVQAEVAARAAEIEALE
jgi:energy-coupling factor transporter ATP-binding protein EcfA2